MAAPHGNKNNSKGRQWEQALRRALARIADSKDTVGTVDRGLEPIADKVVSLATEGDLDAIREIACRLDGKPSEHVFIEQELTVNVGESESIGDKLTKSLASRQVATIQ